MTDVYRIRKAPQGYQPLFNPDEPEEQPYMLKKAPDGFTPSVAFDEEESWLDSAVRYAGDVGKTFMSGAARTGQTVGFLTERLGDALSLDGTNILQEAGAALKERAGESAEWWNSKVSEGFRKQAEANIIEKDESSPLGYSIGDDWTMTTIVAGAAASLNEMMLTAGAAKGAAILSTAALKRGAPQLMKEAAAGGVRANKILKRAQQIAGALGGGLTEGALAGGASGVAIEEDIMGRDHDDLMVKSDRYREIYNATEGEEDEEARQEYARRTLAREAANSVALNVGLATAGLGAPMGAFFGTLGRKVAASGAADTAVGKAVKEGALKLNERMGFAATVAKGAAGEAAQEFAQSGAEQVLQNLGIREYADFTQDPWEGVLNAAVTGGIVGGVLGAGTTAIFESGEAPGGVKPTGSKKPPSSGKAPKLETPPPKFAKPSEAMMQRVQKTLDEVQSAGVPASEFMKVARWAGRNQLDGAPGDRTVIEFNRALEILRDTGKAPEFIDAKVGEDIDGSGYLTQQAFVKDAAKFGFETSARFAAEPGKLDEVMGALAKAGATGYVMNDGSVVVPVRKQGESALQMVAQQVQGATGVAFTIGAPEESSNAVRFDAPTQAAGNQAAAPAAAVGEAAVGLEAAVPGTGRGSDAGTAGPGAQAVTPRAENVARQITESGLQPELVAARPSGAVEIAPDAPPDVAERAIEIAANDAATSPLNDFREPSDAEISSGNYRKGKVKLAGFKVSVENPAGSIRKSRPGAKSPWQRKMKNHYGYIPGTKSQDGEPLDVYLGRGANDPKKQVFVVQQLDPKTGEFDEHKVMLGFDSEGEAKNAYLSHFPKGWNGFGSIIAMTNEQAREWMKRGDTDVPINPFNREPMVLQRKFTTVDVPAGIDGAELASEVDGEFTGKAIRVPVASEGRVRRAIQKRQGVQRPEQEVLREELSELKTELNTSRVTGLPNKKAFDEAVRTGKGRGFFHRSGDEFAAIFDDGRIAAIDMDGLKRINDTLSHDAADAILRELGAFLQTVQTSGRPAEAVMQEVQDQLDKYEVHLTYRGNRAIYEGIGISYGIGDTYEDADRNAARQKQERLEAGVREDARNDPTRAPRRFRGPGEAADGPENPGRRSGERREGGQAAVRSGAFEIAPDPNDRELSDRFAALPEAERDQLTHELNALITPQIMGVLGIDPERYVQSFGGYLDQVNPSLSVEFAPEMSREETLRAAAAAGYVYAQDSVILIDKDAPEKVGAVTLEFDTEITRALATKVYQHLRENVGIEGFSNVDGKMLILDFSDGDIAALAERIENSLAMLDGDESVTVAHGQIGATFIGKQDYESTLRGAAGTTAEWEALGDLRRSAAAEIASRLGVERPAFSVAPAAPDEGAVRDAGRVRGSARDVPSADRPYPKSARGTDLEGLPSAQRVDGQKVFFHSFKKAQRVARAYMRDAGMAYNPPKQYVTVDPERSRRIAKAFDEMEHDPRNPVVRAAYDAMIAETAAQFRAIRKYHPEFKVQFIKYAETGDPYASTPRKAILDIVVNNHMWVFSTRDGFGTDATFDPEENPLLAETEFTTDDGEPMLANDLFRVVHDYFGHVMNGVGFRADGEENAWRSHAAMYSPAARMAMTAETRGQNSFVNFSDKVIRGDHPGAGMTVAEWNKGRSGADTYYADQKMGLLPDWVMEDTYEGEMPAFSIADNPKASEEQEASEALKDTMFEFGGVRFISRLRRVIRTNGPKSAPVDKWKRFFERMVAEGKISKEEATFANINEALDDIVRSNEVMKRGEEMVPVYADIASQIHEILNKDLTEYMRGTADFNMVFTGSDLSHIGNRASYLLGIAKEIHRLRNEASPREEGIERKVQESVERAEQAFESLSANIEPNTGSGAAYKALDPVWYLPEGADVLSKSAVLDAVKVPTISMIIRGSEALQRGERANAPEPLTEEQIEEKIGELMNSQAVIDRFEKQFEWRSNMEEIDREVEFKYPSRRNNLAAMSVDEAKAAYEVFIESGLNIAEFVGETESGTKEREETWESIKSKDVSEWTAEEADSVRQSVIDVVSHIADKWDDWARANDETPTDDSDLARALRDYLYEEGGKDLSRPSAEEIADHLIEEGLLVGRWTSHIDGSEYVVSDEDGDATSYDSEDEANRALVRARRRERETEEYIEQLRQWVIENEMDDDGGPSLIDETDPLEYHSYNTAGPFQGMQEWTFHWDARRNEFLDGHFRYNKNLVMHARTSTRDVFPVTEEGEASEPLDTFFIEEFQSDWSQAVDRVRSEFVRMLVNYMGMNTSKASKMVPEDIGLEAQEAKRKELLNMVESHIEQSKKDILKKVESVFVEDFGFDKELTEIAIAPAGIAPETVLKRVQSRFASTAEADSFMNENPSYYDVKNFVTSLFAHSTEYHESDTTFDYSFGKNEATFTTEAIAASKAGKKLVFDISEGFKDRSTHAVNVAFRIRYATAAIYMSGKVNRSRLEALDQVFNKLVNANKYRLTTELVEGAYAEAQAEFDALLADVPELTHVMDRDTWVLNSMIDDLNVDYMRRRGYDFEKGNAFQRLRNKADEERFGHISAMIIDAMAKTYDDRVRTKEAEDYFRDAKAKISSYKRPPLLNAWTDTSFKMFLAHAASKGFTHVAWTSGEIQGRRYRSALTAEYDSVVYRSTDPSVRAIFGQGVSNYPIAQHTVAAVPKYGNAQTFFFDSTGVSAQTIQTARHTMQAVLGKKMSEMLLSGEGIALARAKMEQQAADKNMSLQELTERSLEWRAEQGSYSQMPLNVPSVSISAEELGGSGGGMSQFYDREMVKIAEKFLKSVDPEAKVMNGVLHGQTEGNTGFRAEDGKAPVWVIPITDKVRQALDVDEMPAWSIASPSGKPFTVDQVRDHVADIASSWKAAPKVNVVKSAKDLPSRYSRWLASIGPDKSPRGFYADGQVWMIADALSSREEVESVLFEEALGHFGLRATLGREAFNKLRDDIFDSIKGTPRYKEIANRYKDVVAGLSPTERKRVLADEYLAQVSPNENPSVWKMLIAAVRQWLREHGFVKRWSDNDLIDLMYRVHDGIRTGVVPTSVTRLRQSLVRFGEDGKIETTYRGAAGQGSVFIEDGERLVSIPAAGLSARVATVPGDKGPALAVNEMLGKGPEAIRTLARFAAEEGVAELVFSPFAASQETLKRAGYAVEKAGDGLRIRLSDGWRKRQSGEAPAFSLRHRAEGDQEVERILAKTLEPTPHDLNLWGKMQHYFRMARDRFSIGETMLELKTGWIDSAAAIEELERGQYGGGLLDASQSAYKMVNLTRNLPQLVAAVARFGVPRYDNGSFVSQPGRMGLYDIFRPLHQTADGKNQVYLWEGYAIARRANQLIQQTNRDGTSKEKLLTQDEIDKLLELENQYPHFKSVFDNWQKFNAEMLDLAVDRGVMSREEADLWKQNDYVPFYRVMDEDDTSAGPGGARRHGGFSNQQYKSKRLTGSEKMIEPVTQNIVLNMAALLDRIYKNEAMQRIVALGESAGVLEAEPLKVEAIKFTNEDIAKALSKAGLVVGDDQDPRARKFNRLFWWTDMGVDPAAGYDKAIRVVEQMTDQQKEQWSTLFRRIRPIGNDVVSVSRGGRLEYYRVNDPLVLRAIMDMKSMDFGALVDAMQGAKNLLTNMVTLDPAFMAANWMRDTLSSFVTSSANFVPLSTAIQDARDIWTGDGLSRDLAIAGGVGETFYNPITDLRDVLGKVNPPDGSILVNSPRKLWETYRKIGFVSEQINRFAIARKVLADGGSMAEAAYQAQDIMNFAQRGDSIAAQFLIRTVPFLNARIQGLYRLYKGALGRDAEDPAEGRRRFWTKSIMLGMASMLVALANWDDERYEKLPDDQKDTYWHIFVGNSHFAIPKPFEVGVIAATIPERVVRALAGQDSGREFMASIRRALLDTFAFNPLPQAIKPLVEQWANRNFFTGQPIVDVNLAGLIPEEQANPWTSETARVLARIMPDFLPDGMRSPVRIEAAVRGYLGTIGSYILQGTDSAVAATGAFPAEPADRFPFLPDAPIARFVRPDPAVQSRNKYADDLYAALERADDLYRTVNMMLRTDRLAEAQALVGRRQSELEIRGVLGDFRDGLRSLNTRQRFVMVSDMTPEMKREAIDQINRERNELLEMARPYLKLAE